MVDFLDLASSRRSIRKYAEGDIPEHDIEYFIKAAVNAPSGCNSQCWKFIAVKDRSIIEQIKDAVNKKVETILEVNKDGLPEGYLASKQKMVTFFSNAPVVIAVFMTETQYYDPTYITALKANGYDDKSIMKLFADYDVLSIGAAIQNMLLAIHERGYGACWMNDPAVAGKEINDILKVSFAHKFMSLIPVGIPAYTPRNKKMKEFGEVFKLV